jgi:hypothetical protein
MPSWMIVQERKGGDRSQEFSAGDEHEEIVLLSVTRRSALMIHTGASNAANRPSLEAAERPVRMVGKQEVRTD